MLNLNPDSKCLRKFGLSTGAFLGTAFGLLLPYVFEYPFPVWPWIIAGFLGAAAWAIPISLGPLFQIFGKLLFTIGRFNSTVILGIIFYCVVTPLGVLMRLMGRGPIREKFKESLETYRVPSVPGTKDDFNNPF